MQPKPHGLLKRVWMRAGRAGSFRLHHLAQWLPGVPRLPLCLNFFPKFPHDKYILWKICHSLGLTLTNQPFRRDACNIYWRDDTVRPTLAAAERDKRILNGRCLDVGKLALEPAHLAAFGYQAQVDPTLHDGPAVCKSNLNAKHDGCIVQCPLPRAEPDHVYQRLIDNSASEDEVVDIRVPIVGRGIPFVYLKFRPIASRFANVNSQARFEPVATQLTPVEQQQILDLAARVGLELGEVDVVRDRPTGKIYVIDISHSPYGPPNHLDAVSYHQALHAYCGALLALLRRA
jgi:hypothetical protein